MRVVLAARETADSHEYTLDAGRIHKSRKKQLLSRKMSNYCDSLVLNPRTRRAKPLDSQPSLESEYFQDWLEPLRQHVLSRHKLLPEHKGLTLGQARVSRVGVSARRALAPPGKIAY